MNAPTKTSPNSIRSRPRTTRTLRGRPRKRLIEIGKRCIAHLPGQNPYWRAAVSANGSLIFLMLAQLGRRHCRLSPSVQISISQRNAEMAHFLNQCRLLRAERKSSNRSEALLLDPIRPSSSSQQHACEGIIGGAIGLRGRRAQFRRPTNSMIPRVRLNCRFGDSR